MNLLNPLIFYISLYFSDEYFSNSLTIQLKSHKVAKFAYYSAQQNRIVTTFWEFHWNLKRLPLEKYGIKKQTNFSKWDSRFYMNVVYKSSHVSGPVHLPGPTHIMWTATKTSNNLNQILLEKYFTVPKIYLVEKTSFMLIPETQWYLETKRRGKINLDNKLEKFRSEILCNNHPQIFA